MPSRIAPLQISAYTLASAAGIGRAATVCALRERRSGLRANDFGDPPLATWVGRVPGLEDCSLPPEFAAWESRNNRLAWLALTTDGLMLRRPRRAPASARNAWPSCWVPRPRASERPRKPTAPGSDSQLPADLRRSVVHNPHSLGGFVQHALGLTGVAVTVATACSSSAKVFAQAERLLRLGLADAAVVGGVDTLCNSVLYGFNSLELVSPEPCRPFDVERRGISIGEAAGFALLERDAATGPWLLGYGESSDAHHMSTPHPGGRVPTSPFATRCCAPGWRYRMSATSTCMAPRATRTTRWRRRSLRRSSRRRS